jgi:hypothetical protein
MCNSCPSVGEFLGRIFSFGGCNRGGGEFGCGGERIHSELKCHREFYKIEMIPQPPRTITVPQPPLPVRVPIPRPEPPCPCDCDCGE